MRCTKRLCAALQRPVTIACDWPGPVGGEPIGLAAVCPYSGFRGPAVAVSSDNPVALRDGAVRLVCRESPVTFMSSIPTAVAAAAQPPGAASSRWRALRSLVRLALGLVLSAASLLFIAWLTLHWGILPRIEQWRPQIEARASAALGIPVRIGAIQVRSGSWVPAFELRDVRLLDAQQRPALQLPRVAAAISPRSLLSFELRFAQLLVEGAQLEIRRDAAGRIFIAGLELTAAGRDAEDNGALRDPYAGPASQPRPYWNSQPADPAEFPSTVCAASP